MATVAERVDVTEAATKLTGTALIPAAGQSLLIQPLDGDIRIGGSGVTWAAGYPVPSGTELAIKALEDLYGIADEGATVEVAVIRQLVVPPES